MGASAYVGRVGGLAVALGVGAAVATGHGVAWATETDPNSSTSEQSTSTEANANSPASPSEPSASTPSTGVVEADEGEGAEDAEEGSDQAAGDTQDTEDAADTDGADEDIEEAEEADAEPDEATDQAGTADESEPDVPEETPQATIDEDATHGAGHVGLAETSDSNASNPAANVVARSVEVIGDTTVDAEEANTGLPLSSLAAESTTVQAQTFMTAMQDVAPVTMAAPQAEAKQPLLQRVVVNLLSSLGFGPMASKLPGAPVWSPFVMALLGLGSRREFSQPVSPLAKTVGTTPVAALALTDLATAAVTTYPGTTRNPVYVSGNTRWIEFVTGPGNLNNTTSRFGIGGTDLGIMWDNGITDNPATPVDEHQVLIAFGDTFSNRTPVRTGVWRFNTLFRSADDVLNNGLYVPNGVPVNHVVQPPNGAHFSGSPMENPNWSDPILPSPGDPVHPPYAIGPEVTLIPTAGISVPHNNAYGARQYMSFMSIRSWDTPGRWTTNYSGVAYSDDNGQTWDIAPTSIRTAAAGRATVPYVSGNQNFQQGAFVKPPADSPEAAQGWVYSYGTPSGRAGTVYVSRVQQNQILDTTKYQYWNGSSWVANAPSAATPILPGKTSSFFGFFKRTTYPSASEMSVQYNPYLDKYVMLYGDSSNKIVMRTASSPQGTWSAPTTLVSSYTLSGKYAPYIHPWSGTSNLPASEQQYLYWNLSTWNDYQVRLMRTDLTKV